MKHIPSRSELGSLYQDHFKTGIGAEIGVQYGFNSLNILKQWKGRLICIDLWADISVYATALGNLNGNDVTLFRSTSENAAIIWKRINPSLQFDWVYIDADHSYEAVKKDFESWYPLVRVGGIVSGHDYAPATNPNDCDGVRQFIDEFCINNPEIQMNFTTDDFWEGKEYQTWWFVKPGESFDGMAKQTTE